MDVRTRADGKWVAWKRVIVAAEARTYFGWCERLPNPTALRYWDGKTWGAVDEHGAHGFDSKEGALACLSADEAPRRRAA